MMPFCGATPPPPIVVVFRDITFNGGFVAFYIHKTRKGASEESGWQKGLEIGVVTYIKNKYTIWKWKLWILNGLDGE